MTSIFASTYLSRRPIEKAMRTFAKNFSPEQKVLDIGCGTKPYAHLFDCDYVGVDPLEIVAPDIVADAATIPVADASFDGIILNQSLEHISNTTGVVSEVERILKPGGICIVTAPHTVKNHSEPIPASKAPLSHFSSEDVPYWQEDYYRFTKFGLLYLFQNFTVTKIEETSGYCGTMMQMINYFFTSSGKMSKIFTPIYLLCNIIGKGTDLTFFFLGRKTSLSFFRKFYDLIYSSLPLNYILVIKKNDASS